MPRPYMPLGDVVNPDAQGTPYGHFGSSFDRPTYNEQFFSMGPQQRLDTLRMFQSRGGEFTPSDQTMMQLLGEQVAQQRALAPPPVAAEAQAAPASKGLLGSLLELFQAADAANPFEQAGNAMQYGMEQNRRSR